MKLLTLALLTTVTIPLLAQSDHSFTAVILCYKATNGKFYNITVPSYMVPRYIAKGAQPGPCVQ